MSLPPGIPISELPPSELAKLHATASKVLAYFDNLTMTEDDGEEDKEVAAREALYAGASYTNLSDAQCADILARFYPSLGTFEAATMLSGGLSNSNFHVTTTTGGEYLLKVCDEKNADELQVQLDALAVLKRHGFPAAYPVPQDDDGGELLLYDDVEGGVTLRVIVFDFLRGANPKRLTLPIAREMGKNLATMHLIDEVPESLGEFPMGYVQMKPFLEVEAPASEVPDHAFVHFLAEQLQELLPVVTKESYEARILHGDLFLENTMFDGDKLIGFIDFEECCKGPILLDLTMTVVGCCYRSDNSLNWDLTHALLKAYHAVLPLSEEHCRDFVPFLRYSLLSIAFWRFRQFNVRRPDERRKDAHNDMVVRITNITQDLAKWTEVLSSLDA